MLSDGALAGLALQARRLLHTLDEAAIAPFLVDWPDLTGSPRAADGLRGPGGTGARLPVLRWLADFAADECEFGASLVTDLCRNHQLLIWRQTYAAGDVDDAFLRNYGYTEIVGLNSIASRRIACGFLILGPSTLYPRHRHEAAEIYIPLRGTARWQQSDAVWRERPPGAVILHTSDEPHSMQTGTEPLLALYLWRSEQLNQKAHLDRDTPNGR